MGGTGRALTTGVPDSGPRRSRTRAAQADGKLLWDPGVSARVTHAMTDQQPQCRLARSLGFAGPQTPHRFVVGDHLAGCEVVKV